MVVQGALTLQGNHMKKIGIVLIIVGMLWATIAFNMSTSVDTGGETFGAGQYSIEVPKMRVNNLGLMEDRRNHLMFAGLTILVGVMLLGFGTVSERRNSPALVTTGTRACPYCAELVKSAALICRFCNKDLPPAPITSVNNEASELPSVNTASVEIDAEQQRTMEQYAITYDGEKYHFREYRYDKLNDAINYAKAQS